MRIRSNQSTSVEGIFLSFQVQGESFEILLIFLMFSLGKKTENQNDD